ncbi:MAG: TonB-dependent receptor plug domain-containing protein [Bacteroidales bacterium]|nr:TonB-dependent receptor plug domain-containing protein [Bacteroidales bacterium]MCF8458956.1 TonB-dependent receptor plug domain-containing protein [Bacteroidales bacterium]
MRHHFILLLIAITWIGQLLHAQVKKDSISHLPDGVIISDSLMNSGYIYDPMFLIKGKVAGASISKNGGHPGVPNQMIIRGLSSMYFNSYPVYVIDGAIVADPDLVFPEDIESIEVLKDISSTAKYGSFGGNGVVLINTKSPPTDKKLKLTYSSVLSYDKPANKLDLASAEDIRNFVAENNLNFEDGGADEDWQENIMQNAMVHSHSISASGMLGKTGYAASVGYKNQPGLILNSMGEKITGNFKVSQLAFKDRLKIEASWKGSQHKVEGIDPEDKRDVFLQTYQHNPTDPVYEADWVTYDNTPRNFQYYNPVAMLNEIENSNTISQSVLNLNLRYKLTQKLKISSSFSTAGYKTENDLHIPPLDSYIPNFNVLENQQLNTKWLDLKGQLDYSSAFGNNQTIQLSTGYFYRKSTSENQYFELIENLTDNPNSDPLWTDENKWKDENKLLTNAVFASLDYAIKTRYFLHLSCRYDKLNDDTPKHDVWGTEIKSESDTSTFLPAISFEWRISNEKFLKNNKTLSFLSLQAGYGKAGKQSNSYYVNNGLNLNFECVKEWNIGLAYGFFKNKINGSIKYYKRESMNSFNQVHVDVPPNPFPYKNDNSMQVKNTGLEFDLHALIINTKNFRFLSSFLISKNTNTVSHFNQYGLNLNEVPLTPYTDNMQYITAEGKPLFAFDLADFAGFSEDNAMLFHTEEGTFSRYPSNARRNTNGQVMPEMELSWNNNFEFFENFDFSFALRYVKGHSIYNANGMWLNQLFFPGYNALSSSLNDAPFIPETSTYYLEDASYLRLDNMVIGYTINLKKEGKFDKKLRIYVGANNLFTITSYSGLDPEINYNTLSMGLENMNVYPPVKSFFVGVKLDL